MGKNITIKIIKGFEIKKDSKYVLVLPSYLGQDPKVGAAIIQLFRNANSEVVGVLVKNPDDVKILEVPTNGKIDRKSKPGKT